MDAEFSTRVIKSSEFSSLAMLSELRNKISELLRIIDNSDDMRKFGVPPINSVLVECVDLGLNILDVLRDEAKNLGFVFKFEKVKDLYNRYPNPALITKKTLIVVIPTSKDEIVELINFANFIRPYRNITLITLDFTGELKQFINLFDEVLILDSVSEIDKRQLIKSIIKESRMFEISDREFETVYSMLSTLTIQEIISIFRRILLKAIVENKEKIGFQEIEKFISERIERRVVKAVDASQLFLELYPNELLDQLYMEAIDESGDEFLKLIISLNKNKIDEKMQKLLLRYPFVLADKPMKRLLRYHKAKQILEKIKKALESD